MAANARIVAIDYDPPGRDVQGEHVIILNVGTTPLDLKDWTLRDVAPMLPHVYTFKQFSLPPSGQVRVWTKTGSDTSTDVFWNLDAAIWNNPGDTAILHDAAGVEVSRFRYVPLPPGAAPLQIAVPAFWTLDPKYQPYWQAVKQAGHVVSITVIEGSWPATAKNNSTWKGQAQSHLDTLPGAVLGYVSTRDANFNLLPQTEILTGPDTTKADNVTAWYDQFGQQIDGIYFDELVLPQDPGSVSAAVSLVTQFKQGHPTAKAMILAGQCIDEAVVGQDIDWALLWESRLQPSYRENFYPLVLKDPLDTGPIANRDTLGKPIPSWWKNPQHRQKIVHVVHDCSEPDRQHTLGLAKERNAGHVFVMDRRGLTPTGKDELYDHLPPYWDVEVREADSYYDFGLDPERALLAAHRYGVGQGKVHAWPNFEQAWYPAGHVRGTFLLDAGTHATQLDVLQADLPGTPSLFDISALWNGAHRYAQAQGYETALPTFEQVKTANGLALRMILFAKNLSWLEAKTVPLASTYQQPTFAEPGAVVRNVNRWAESNGYKASFPTFVPDNPNNPRGRTALYNCYVLHNAAPVIWEDVPTPVYIQQL